LTRFDEDRSLRLPNLRVTLTLPDRKTLVAPLGLAPPVLGQHEGCDLVLTDPKVSRRHSAAMRTKQGGVIVDLKSGNGMLVWDARFTEVLLPPSVPITLLMSHHLW